VTAAIHTTITVGADNWQSLNTSASASPQTLTGSLSNAGISRNHSHNTGGFLQGQLALADKLFLTYGMRADWNPNYGNKAKVLPGRYGIAWTSELGTVTAKLRGSYGRSTRPPAAGLSLARLSTESLSGVADVPFYGIYSPQLANPELVPEQQQGGEGGIELYLGNRGSLVVTRYNQTVDQLIDFVSRVDSVRSFIPNPPSGANSFDADGYGYRVESQYLNIGSIRNQGWELQGTVNVGPLSARGVYSWTKSRTIGITPKYRSRFSVANYPTYQPGATFRLFPEHTWSLGLTYGHANTTLALNVNGVGTFRNSFNDFYYLHMISIARAQTDIWSLNGSQYASMIPGYALVDLNASHRFTSNIEGIAQLQNANNRYVNDLQASGATIGRQTKVGMRVRL
jgi:outer membrane cobalamin receptor